MAGKHRQSEHKHADPPQPAVSTRERQLEQLLLDLEVHHEELRSQQMQLIDSQRALEEARDRYAELFDFAPIAFIVVDSAGTIQQANLCCSRLVGMDRHLLIGSPLFVHVVPQDRRSVLNHMTSCRRGDVRVNTEVTLQPRDSASRLVELLSTPAHASSVDGPVVFLTAIVDLEERQRAEAEHARARDEEQRLRHEEQLARTASEAKDRFIAMLSHELRTPLTPILFALDEIKTRHQLSEPLGSTMDMIRRNVLLETRLIDDLLDMTRIVQGRMSIVPDVMDAHAAVDDVLLLCRHELNGAGVALEVNAAAREHHVCADPARLQQVLWNVLRNAIRNTPSGGRISIRTGNSEPGWLAVTVSDTGRGISRKDLERIFSFFEQDDEARRRGVGLGLGLPISRAIIELHGGRIRGASGGLGHGAEFVVELPTVRAPTESVSGPQGQRGTAGQPATILLVEDNNDSAAAMAEFLRVHGYQVKHADCVHDALRLADEADILVSDIALPDGTGHELMRAIREQRSLPGIALSGYGTSEDVRRSLDAGFEQHIVKPIEPARLLEAIRNLRRS
jgi:PAS domain S-box-containing protein